LISLVILLRFPLALINITAALRGWAKARLTNPCQSMEQTTMTKTKMTTEERIRRNKARAKATAVKRIAAFDVLADFDKIVGDYVLSTGQQEGKARVCAMAFSQRFGADAYRLIEAEPAGDNEKAQRKGLLEERAKMRKAAIDRGLSNPNKPWSDMLKVWRELANPYGETREPKPVAKRVRDSVTALYKTIGKMEAPDEKLMDAQRKLGEILVLYGIDLAAINAKL
jgi:hypothetical protein